MCNLTQGSVLSDKWVALYVPGPPEMDKHLLPSLEAAWSYVYDQMCIHCQQERARALAAEEEGTVSTSPNGITGFEDDVWVDRLNPSCAYEWDVMTEEEYASIYSGEIR